jgi:hypothetical protein
VDDQPRYLQHGHRDRYHAKWRPRRRQARPHRGGVHLREQQGSRFPRPDLGAGQRDVRVRHGSRPGLPAGAWQSVDRRDRRRAGRRLADAASASA